MKVCIAIYHHRFGTDIAYCGVTPITEEEVAENMVEVWEPERGEWIDIYDNVPISHDGQLEADDTPFSLDDLVS